MKGFVTVSFLTILFMVSEGLGVSFTKKTIVDTLSKPRQAIAVDLDNDGDLDIVGIKDGSGSQGLCWQNDGAGNFSGPYILYQKYEGGRAVVAGDIDNDGHVDIVVGSKLTTNAIVWYKNNETPFNGEWSQQTTEASTEECYILQIGDIDNDGDPDIAAAYGSEDDIVWLRNDGGNPVLFEEILVDGFFKAALGVTVADINGTGDLDIVGGSFWDNDFPANGSDGFAWWEYNGSNYIRKEINYNQDFAGPVFPKDIDRDGSIDIIGATLPPDSRGNIIWWSNDGSGNFGSDNILISHNGLASIFARDLEGDGDIDIMGSTDKENSDSLFWLENNGSQVFNENIILYPYDGARFVGAYDFDADGDPDILAVALGDPGNGSGDISWFENDAEDAQTVASGESSLFWNDKVEIIVNSSSGGSDEITVFYDSEEVPDTGAYASTIKKIAPEGFYTLTTQKTSYNTTLKFSYAGVPRWNFYSEERDLVICTLNGSQWEKAGTSQTVFTDSDTILVEGVTSFGKFTLAEVKSVEANNIVFLEGPYNSGAMNTNIINQLPLNQPYDSSPWNYNGSESVSSMPSTVVDWVLLELRTGTVSSTKVASRAAFLKSNGSIVDLDGTSQVHIAGIEEGNYYLVLRHRNHQAVMSASAQALSEGNSSLYNFTDAMSKAYTSGPNPMKELETGTFGMRGGDGNSDGGVDAIDINTIWRPQNGTPWLYTKYGDFNLDGGIDALDINLIWRPNNGTASQVPN